MIYPPDRLEYLCNITTMLATLKEHDEDRVWARVTEKVAAALECEAATYFVYVHKTDELVIRAALGVAATGVIARRIQSGSGICGWVAKYREPIMTDEPQKDPRFLKSFDEATGFKTTRVMAIPLFDKLELTGVIELLNKKKGAFDALDLAFVQSACMVATLALRGSKLETTVDKVTAHNASILENLGGGFLAVDLHSRLMLCNPAARKILDIPDSLELNQPVAGALTAIPELEEILHNTLVKKETLKRQELAWKKGDQARVLGYSTLLIQDPRGQVVGAGITFQDITQFAGKKS